MNKLVRNIIMILVSLLVLLPSINAEELNENSENIVKEIVELRTSLEGVLEEDLPSTLNVKVITKNIIDEDLNQTEILNEEHIDLEVVWNIIDENRVDSTLNKTYQASFIDSSYNLKIEAVKIIYSTEIIENKVQVSSDTTVVNSFVNIFDAIAYSETLNKNDNVTIKLLEDIFIDASGFNAVNASYIEVGDNIVFDGNNKTIHVEAWSATNNSLLSLGHNTTLKNITIDGNNLVTRHGINLYLVNNVTLENVTSKNNKATGIVINGSEVTAINTNTNGNGWGGINVGKGLNVSETPSLTFISGNISEETKIWADNVDDSLPTTAYVTIDGYYTMKYNNALIWIDNPIVSVENTAYLTLQEAINESNGETIVIHEDIIITENIIVDKDVSIIGKTKDVTISNSGSVAYRFVVANEKTLSFENLKFDIHHTLIYPNNPINLVFNNSDIEITNGYIFSTDSVALDVIFTNNRVSGNVRKAFIARVNQENSLIIDNNTFEYTGGEENYLKSSAMTIVVNEDGDNAIIDINNNLFKGFRRVFCIDHSKAMANWNIQKNKFINVEYVLNYDSSNINNQNISLANNYNSLIENGVGSSVGLLDEALIFDDSKIIVSPYYLNQELTILNTDTIPTPTPIPRPVPTIIPTATPTPRPTIVPTLEPEVELKSETVQKISNNPIIVNEEVVEKKVEIKSDEVVVAQIKVEKGEVVEENYAIAMDETVLDSSVAEVLQIAEENNVAPVLTLYLETPKEASRLEISLETGKLNELLVNEEATLEIKTDTGLISLDPIALESILSQAYNENITFIVDAPKEISDSQKTVIGDDLALTLKIQTEDEYISDFNGGKISVSVPYKLENPNESKVTVYYVSEDGNLERMETEYSLEENMLVFKTNHFSTFVIREEKINSDVSELSDVSHIVEDKSVINDVINVNSVIQYIILVSLMLLLVGLLVINVRSVIIKK